MRAASETTTNFDIMTPSRHSITTTSLAKDQQGPIRAMGQAKMNERRRIARQVSLSLAPWIAAVALWYGIRLSGYVNVSLIPAPHQVAARFVDLLLHEGLLFDIYLSSRRVLLGVVMGITAAVPIGFMLGWYRPARTLADPMINFFRALPPIALIPLVIVYFGVDETAKIVILFYAAFFSGVIVMYEGVSQITPLYIRVAQTLGASELEIFRKVIIPLTLPHILTALRVALGVSWATLVASELIAAQRGLGALIQNAATYFLLDVIYVGIICIGCVALLMDTVLRLISARLLVWQERAVA
jgi:NitT/TauT family transport system permease protein